MLREAIGDYVSPQEIQQVKSTLSPSVAGGFLRALSQMRRTGKQVDIASAARQYSQFMNSQGVSPDVGLIKLGKDSAPGSFEPVMPDVGQSSIPKPFQSTGKRQSSPSSLKPKSKVATQPKVDTSRLKGKPKPKPAKTSRGTMFQQPQSLPSKRSDISQHTEPLPPLEKRRAGLRQAMEDPGISHKDYESESESWRDIFKTSPMYQRGGRTDAERLGVTKRESRQMSKKVKNILLYEVKRIKTKRILREQLLEQKRVQYLAVGLLTEGPLAKSVWQNIKSAGTSALQGLSKGFGGQTQKAGMSSVDDRAKKAMQLIDKSIKAAEAERRKFNSEVLKTAQLMNSYHNAVTKAYAIYKQYESILGPSAMQVNRQVNDILEALENDLMSEVSQIEAMFKNVQKKDVSIDKMLKKHKTRMGEQRENEADAAARMQSSFGRTGEMMPSKARLPKVDVPFREKEEDPDMGARERVKVTDQATLKKYEDQMEDIQSAFEETSKDLFKRLMKTKDPEEKKSLTRQMYDLTKSKIEREKELKNMMKGIGIKSKAGMTALRNARKGK